MLENISFGKYFSAKSFIHNLDGRTKFVDLVTFAVLVCIAKNPVSLAILLGFLTGAVILSKVPVSIFLRSIWKVRYYLFVCILVDLVSDFSKDGLVKTAILTSKLVLCVIAATLFTLTTTVSHISDSLEWILYPLKVFKVPVRDIAVMLSIALRFIPVLAEESDRILMAQKARGASVDSGTLIKRAKSVVPLIVPIFASAIRRAADLSEALTARAYGLHNNRTRLHPLCFTNKDLIAFVTLITFTIFVIRSEYGC